MPRAGRFADVKAIGISYQMHGLVLVDRDGSVLGLPSSGATVAPLPYGNRVFEALGGEESASRGF